jgi:hypothetical protein
MASPVTEFVS